MKDFSCTYLKDKNFIVNITQKVVWTRILWTHEACLICTYILSNKGGSPINTGLIGNNTTEYDESEAEQIHEVEDNFEEEVTELDEQTVIEDSEWNDILDKVSRPFPVIRFIEGGHRVEGDLTSSESLAGVHCLIWFGVFISIAIVFKIFMKIRT
jgi:hypothetical protein